MKFILFGCDLLQARSQLKWPSSAKCLWSHSSLVLTWRVPFLCQFKLTEYCVAVELDAVFPVLWFQVPVPASPQVKRQQKYRLAQLLMGAEQQPGYLLRGS